MAMERWAIDSSHSEVRFKVRHLVIAKVTGRFTRWSGTVLTPANDFTRASVEVTIDASSIDTGVADRDAHLRSADFFDTERYPELTFRTRRVEQVSAGHLRLVGDLTMKGVTREVPLDVENLGRVKDPWGNERAAFTATASIDRKDFGLSWNQVLETGGLMVSDRVDLEIEVEAVRQADTKAA